MIFEDKYEVQAVYLSKDAAVEEHIAVLPELLEEAARVIREHETGSVESLKVEYISDDHGFGVDTVLTLYFS